MREYLRPLPPAYVRGSYPSWSEENFPIYNQEVLTSHENAGLPPYTQTDPMAAAASGTIDSEVQPEEEENATRWRANVGPDGVYWIAQRRRIEDEREVEEIGDEHRTSFERNVASTLALRDFWIPQRPYRSEEFLPERDGVRTSFERSGRTVPEIRVLRADEMGVDSFASNVEAIQPRRRRGRRLCCDCSKVCWAFWMFWVLVIAVPAIVVAARGV